MAQTFTIDSLIRRGIFHHPIAAEYTLDGQRLGSIELPDPWEITQACGTRSPKRALEILILASTFGASGYQGAEIDDNDGRSERPDFRVRIPTAGEVGVEVTQLRSGQSAARVAAAKKFESLLREKLLADERLAHAYAQTQVNIQISPKWLGSASQDAAAAAVLDELRNRLVQSRARQPALPFFVHAHHIDEQYSPLRGLFVSPPLPPYGQRSDIDVVRLVNQKRIDARGYDTNLPLWLVAGITADFAQLEVALDDAIASVCEALPFRAVFVGNGREARVLRATPPCVISQSDRDVLGRAWHEAGHVAAAVRLGIPLVSVTLDRENGSEMGFTEIAGDIHDATDDALFTAAGPAAQLNSGFTPQHIAESAAYSDRIALEKIIAPRLGIDVPSAQYHFADESMERALEFVQLNVKAIDALGKQLAQRRTLSGKECRQIANGYPAGLSD